MRGRKRICCVLSTVAVLLAVFLLLRRQGLVLFWNEKEPGAYEVFGVDVSSYQGDVDWYGSARVAGLAGRFGGAL